VATIGSHHNFLQAQSSVLYLLANIHPSMMFQKERAVQGFMFTYYAYVVPWETGGFVASMRGSTGLG
jgi:hypothetical protein